MHRIYILDKPKHTEIRIKGLKLRTHIQVLKCLSQKCCNYWPVLKELLWVATNMLNCSFSSTYKYLLSQEKYAKNSLILSKERKYRDRLRTQNITIYVKQIKGREKRILKTLHYVYIW